MWRGWVGAAYPFTGPFVCRCLTSRTLLRFHIPLIEPDMQISRIRLPEEVSRFRTRKAASPASKPNQPKRGVQAFGRKSPEAGPCHFVFNAQPLTKPLAGMLFYGPIGFAD